MSLLVRAGEAWEVVLEVRLVRRAGEKGCDVAGKRRSLLQSGGLAQLAVAMVPASACVETLECSRYLCCPIQILRATEQSSVRVPGGHERPAWSPRDERRALVGSCSTAPHGRRGRPPEQHTPKPPRVGVCSPKLPNLRPHAYSHVRDSFRRLRMWTAAHVSIST